MTRISNRVGVRHRVVSEASAWRYLACSANAVRAGPDEGRRLKSKGSVVSTIGFELTSDIAVKTFSKVGLQAKRQHY